MGVLFFAYKYPLSCVASIGPQQAFGEHTAADFCLRCNMGKHEPQPVLFWRKVDRRGDDDCWEWQASKYANGHGQFAIDRKPMGAHRFSWMLHFGDIPDGLFVCHKCDNPPCVNPRHLFLGTPLDNIRDMDRKGRRVVVPNRGCENGKSKLTAADVAEIRSLLSTKQTYASIGRLFGVTYGVISNIDNGRTYKND